MTVRSTVPITVVAMLAGVVFALAPDSAAHATHDGIELSSDNITWSSASHSSLFADLGLVVPGDIHSTELWVRNSTSEAAMLRVSGRNATASSATFGDALSVAAGHAGRPGSAHTVTAIGSCLQLMSDEVLEAGESRMIIIDVAFADVGEAIAATDTASVDIRASLMDPSAEELAATACPPGATMPVLPSVDGGTPGAGQADGGGVVGLLADHLPKGVLAFTGGSIYPSIMVAVFALLSGSMLLAAARRRRRSES